MIDLTRIHSEALSTDPYRWAHIDELFGPSDATSLAASYPDQRFKTLVGSDGRPVDASAYRSSTWAQASRHSRRA